MTAIVTCGETRQSLAAVRAFGRAGIPVAVAAKRRPCLAMWSRYATSTFLTEDEEVAPSRFVFELAEEIRARYALCALASTDPTWWALSRFREFLPDMMQRILPPHYSVVRSLDLEALHHFAHSLGIPCAPLVRIKEGASEDLVLNLIKHLDFPLLVRPITPWLLREDGALKADGPMVLQSREHLSTVLKDQVLENGFLVSGYKISRALSYFGVAEKGKVIVEGFQERLHELEPCSEIATLAATISPVPKIRSHGQNLLMALQWQGPFKIDFIKDHGSQYKLLKLTGRLWSSLELAIKAGVNIPLITYGLAENNFSHDLLVNARHHVRLRWLAGDVLAKVSHPYQTAKDLTSLVFNFDPRSFYRHYLGKEKYESYIDVLDSNDPMPFIFELQDKTWKKVLHIR